MVQQISILEGFLKDRVTLKTGLIILKIQLCIARIISILYIKKRTVILICNIINNITVLLHFRSNKLNLGEHKKRIIFLNSQLNYLLIDNIWPLLHHIQ